MLGMFPYPPEVTRGSYDSAKYENVFKMKFPSTSEVNGGSYEMKDNQCDMIQSFRPLAR